MKTFIVQLIYSLGFYANPFRYSIFVDLPGIGNSLTIPPAPQWVSQEPPTLPVIQIDELETTELDTSLEAIDYNPQTFSVQSMFKDCLWPDP